MYRPFRLAILGLLCAQAALLGQSATPAPAAGQDPSPPLTFRSAVDLIDVDVFVTDGAGRFIRDLTRDDFEIVEDGRPQEIRAFSFIDVPVEQPAMAAPSDTVNALEPDVVTNTSAPGRVWVILMDSPSTARPGGMRTTLTYDAQTKIFTRQFVEEAVAPGDLAAIVHAQGTYGDSQGFTTSRSLLFTSIDRYGRGLSGDIEELTDQERIVRNLNTYRAIQDVSERLGAMSGRRRAIIWIGGQVRFDPADLCGGADPNASPESTTTAALCASAPALLAAYRDAIGAATRNNVAVYPVDPSGLTPDLGIEALKRTSALRQVAEDTGGLAVVGTNNFSGGYQAILRDTSTYYVLGYSPATEYRDGRFHDIQVRVTRPGLTVRARRGYYAPAPDARAPERPRLPDGVSEAARAALQMPVATRGLNLELFSAPFRGTGGDRSVVVGGRISGDLRLGAADTVALSYQVFTQEGKILTGEYKVFELNLKPDTRATVEASGLHFVDRIDLPPGRYELRFVADQAGGVVGSVVAPLDVPVFDGALALSGLTLTASSTAEHLTLREDPPLRAALGANPTSARRFRTHDIVTVFAEVYSDDTRLTDDDLSVTGIVTTAGGDEVKREIGWPAREDGGGTDRAWSVKLELSLADLDPGRYVLTVEAASERDPDRSAQRRVVFTVEE